MDLHTWITQQVDRVEASARAELDHRQVVFQPHSGGPAITGVVTGATQCADGIQLNVAQCSVEPRDGTPAPVETMTVVLRRCEADRRILARHNVAANLADSPTFATACDGCRCEWLQDECEPFVDNVNDCPELLDLAHAHGITPDVLAGLDRPQPPEPDRNSGYTMRVTHWPTSAITTSDVPEALRGPRWKP
ncbi:hypothetical protein ACFYX8_35175 [Streptomyces cyaneofuscatus]|uniref:hypothetical protein n=1 Tax=Streptomyces cyaneofuscatus TaxID=66883 RepID=UPI0036C2F05D